MGERNSAILLIHDDPELLDTLTHLLEERGIEVAIAASAFAATSKLSESEEGFDVIVCGWDSRGKTGAKVYRWVLENRYQLRERFVFLASEPPREYEELVEGSCVLLTPDSLDEIVRVVESAVTRVRKSARSRADIHDLEWVEKGAPTLLLVEDEPLQLSFMVKLFRDLGFSVTPAESGNAAIVLLTTREFDVMLSDWYMPNGSGADLFEWVSANKPHLLARSFFMSGGVGQHALSSVPTGCQILPKGQDSDALVKTLIDAAQASRRR